MMEDKRIRDYVESILETEEDLIRLNDIISEIKVEKPELSEIECVIEALEQLSNELKGAAYGMFSMAKSIRRDDKLKDLGI